jgi:uncharacterized protein YjiS (DUF1127 family)
METAMTSEPASIFAPRPIAHMRAKRACRSLSVAAGKIARSLRSFGQRMARDWQYQRELALLMHADDRMLADIGLTRHDVIAAAQEGRSWLHRHDALRAARLRRDEAMAAASLRRHSLPQADAPPLAPDQPRAMETSNFR